MNPTHIGGVDPGLVHTGAVRLVFDQDSREIHVQHAAIAGPNAYAVHQWLLHLAALGIGVLPRAKVYIEGYKPRSHFGTDARMTEAVSNMKREIPGSEVLLNTGVKKVVGQPLMELLGVWKFSTVTHHQDLRSAARIALLGMLKDPETNALLASVVIDHLEGRSWRVHH